MGFQNESSPVMGGFPTFFPLLVVTAALNVVAISPVPSLSRNAQGEHTIGNLPLLLASWEKTDKMKDKMEMDKESGTQKTPKDTYDFIVVGAGTAGSIVAARLSEHFSVILLEAGGQPHSSHDNSAMTMLMGKHKETDWMYKSIIQNESCVLCPDRKYVFSAGKGLGGSANLNYLDTLYEGSFEDYTEWMEATKDPGWGYYMLHPYFKRVKDFLKKKYTPLPGEIPYYRSTFKALIRPTPYLEVQKYSYVNKLIIDNNDGISIRGVEYERHEVVKRCFATKEVIVSAGTFGSPRILILSGIGPSTVLSSIQIPIVADLPVGKNYHDHLAIPLGPFLKSNEPAPANISSKEKEQFRSAWNSSSILRMPLVNLKYSLFGKEMADFLGVNATALKRYMQSSQNKTTKTPSPEDDSIFINVAIKKPISRGEVSISGNDPSLPPVINPNYLNAIYHKDTFAYSSEKQKLIEALEDTVRLLESNPNWKAKFTDSPFPGCEEYILRGYGYWDCYIRHFSMSFNHGVGTCAMGASTVPQSSVVDPDLRVHGVKNLRVIDASVIPTIVSTFPFLSVAGVAERGAEIIVKAYRSTRKSDTASTQLEINEKDHAANDAQPFAGFRIKKLSYQVPPTTIKPKLTAFTMTQSWKKADQIVMKAYSHEVNSSLTETDLIPPDEPQAGNFNPSYFPVKPLAGMLIFHPVIPRPENEGLNLSLGNWSHSLEGA